MTIVILFYYDDYDYFFRFFALNVGIVYLYHAFFHGVDEEDFGGIWELMKEGMMTSFALFLVS